MKKYIISAFLALALPAVVLAAFRPATLTNGVRRVAVFTEGQAKALFAQGYKLETKNQDLGSGSGQDHYSQELFHGGLVIGGNILNASTTLTSARTLTAREVCNNPYIHVNSAAVAGTLAAASLDITLPATSTLFADCLRINGDSVSFRFRNNSPTAASTTEIVAGSGIDLRMPEATGADVLINGLNDAIITIKRVDDVYADGGSLSAIADVVEYVVGD